MSVYRGDWVLPRVPRIAVVVSQFNAAISEALLEGALATLERFGLGRDQVDVVWVPGAFEIPGVARKLQDRYDALITLGAVIRGETPHFDYVAGAVATGVARLAQEGKIPVIFGVLTCNTVEEAEARAGGKQGNKGSEAALAALEMISLYDKLSGA
ncbi:MAG: 6,7-dimethyl-8-ribityllumazine synthase [Firmicutes bacterium]|nr:6,7-dimethyl-8-ribityllumazine synthase [Bacillota bacterium]